MDQILDLLAAISPIISALIAATITFFITKYTYNRNRPLDKLEIAYNMIYYPTYCLIKDSETFNDKILETCEGYFNLYNKYLDRSTIKAFNIVKKNPKSLYAYGNFKSNIIKKNIYLRTRLGYLEPSIFEMYTYSSKLEKHQIKCFLSFMAMYFLAIFNGITSSFKTQIVGIGVVTFLVLCWQILCIIYYYFWAKDFSKVRAWIKNRINKDYDVD